MMIRAYHWKPDMRLQPAADRFTDEAFAALISP